jgi:hypothetical protein
MKALGSRCHVSRAGARFSVTARQTATVTRAITTIPDQGLGGDPLPQRDLGPRTTVRDLQRRTRRDRLTAFIGRRETEHITARGDRAPAAPATVVTGEAEMFAVYRNHAVFIGSPEPMLAVEPPTATTPSSNGSSPT